MIQHTKSTFHRGSSLRQQPSPEENHIRTIVLAVDIHNILSWGIAKDLTRIVNVHSASTQAATKCEQVYVQPH